MEFESFADFIAMGKHGPYVWSSYGIATVIILLNVVQPLLRRRKLVTEMKRKHRREQAES